MAYSKTTWRAGDAITQDKLNKIEQGIADATTASETTASTVSSLSSTVTSHTQSIARVSEVADQALTTANNATTNANNGARAWTQITAAIAESFETHPSYDTLKALIDAIYAKINSNQAINTSNYTTLNGSFATLETEVHEARGTLKNGTNATTLQQKILDIDQLISSNSDSIGVLSETIRNARGTHNSIEARFGAAESAIQDNANDISDIQTEINDAHTQSLTTLVARFQADETAINSKIPLANIIDNLNESGNSYDNVLHAHQGYVLRNIIGGDYTTLNTVASDISSKVSQSDIEKNLTYNTDDNKVLQARQGKLLKDAIDSINNTIGGNYDSSNTIAAAITAAQSAAASDATTKANAAETNAKSYADGLIYNGLDQATAGKALDATQGKALNDIITDQTTGLAAVKTIADRADAAAATANASLGTGFNAQDTVASAIVSINSTLQSKADTSAVNNISTTIVKPKAQVAYTDDVPSSTQSWTINDKDDYLLQAEDNKYYYWKHINGTWHLMGGASGENSGGQSGGGTSSGVFVASLEDVTTPDENVDYFVGNTTDGFLHYRYITIDNTLTPVLIGVDTDVDTANIKRYNIDKFVKNEKNYLRLYEYDYGVQNGINDELNDAMDWVANTSYELNALVVYDGYVYSCTTANQDAEWDSSKWELYSNIRVLKTIELPEGGGGGTTITSRVVRITPATVTTVQNENKIYLRYFYSSVDATGESQEATYTLKYNNSTVIDSGSINSGSNEQQVSIGVWPAVATPGFYQLDVTEYCRLGTQTFNLSIIPQGSTTPILRSWTVEIKELRLESDAPTYQLIETGNSIQFPYIPYGAMTKTLHILVDGTEIDTQNIGAAVSGSQQECTIPAQAHGAHTISIYLETELNGETLTTAAITRDYIWYNEQTANAIIIASPYRYATLDVITDWPAWIANTAYSVGDKVKITNASGTIGYICKEANNDSTFAYDKWTAQVINAEQYEEVKIPYTIYNSNSGTSSVQYYDGETLLDTVTVQNQGTLSYSFETFGQKLLKIKVGSVIMSFNVMITELSVDVAPVSGAVINFDPSSLSNTSINRLPSWTYNNQTYSMTVSDNFNWADDASGGGYKEDADGKCFVIKAGTYAEFNYKMFKQSVDNTNPENPVFTNSVFDKGAEMKVIFKVAAVRDASAVWFTNVGNPSSSNTMPIGIQLSAHQGWLKTSAADAAERQAQQEGTTASTNSYLYFPYSEEDKIELDISINKQGNGENFIMSYEDGVPSKAYAYETSEILYHEPENEAVIRIGSSDCDVYIYRLRIYDKGLSTSDILRNFIADGKNITEKVNRYNRNSIYYNSGTQTFSPYKTNGGVLDPEQLAKKMPDVKILMLEAPTFTKSKKTFVKSRLRCIHADGGTKYPSRGDEDNWLFIDGYHSGQGTTSDNYGQSSRNVDFLFMCDGVHAPTKAKNLSGNEYVDYQSKLYKGNDNIIFNPSPALGEPSLRPVASAEYEACLDWKGDDAKVSLTNTSVPNNYFNLKVNVASSENVNNALFQKRYNDFLRYVYQSPAYKRDNKIKNDMEFVPAILFIRETKADENGNPIDHLEFNDCNWHFYSLGNIGDSKKTDYTRAYDPDDMNEFTVEISDNNTSNSQFQSGVYMSNNQRVVEENDSGINSMNYIWDIDLATEWNATREPTAREIEHDERVDAEADKYLDGTDLENATTKYILPNGKVYVNYRHRMLSGDPFDGKHSFEFRYACKGDYRDGDLINDTNGKVEVDGVQVSRDKRQFDINRSVVEAFYSWVISCSNEEFKQYLSEWCVPEAVEYFYAFTHFYTMMDNRAKNCFWHFGKTGTHRQVHTPYAELLHVYDELVNDEYVRTSDTTIDPNKTYYTEYAFDLWAYDMDTAAGIDNNGELIFPYGKEDTDYRIANVSTSGYVFNGAGSIIWRRLSTSFREEIADIFNQVNEASCFDATNLINEFDRFQDCYPEEMWRLDIERKYIRTFTGKSYDNSKLTDNDNNTKQNTRFLKEMMQGRKKYQRRQWVRDQAIYFGSKYMLNNVRNNTIEMVCYTPDAPLWNSLGYQYSENENTLYRPFVAGDFVFYGDENNRKLYKCIEDNSDSTWDATKWEEGVTPDYKLKITPYQDMYINVAVGNGNLRTPQRAVAGQEYTVDCTANMNETRVYIYAGSYIQALSNLAPFYIGANIFSSAARLKKLDLGTNNSTYHNTNLKSLTVLPNMPILEELNIKNCDNLNTPIDLSGSNNLRIVEAEGSSIPSLSLPMYTSIRTLHLPSTVNTLTLYSARNLTSFSIINKATGQADYSSLLNMNITDSDYSANINWVSIAAQALSHLTSLYLQGLYSSSINNIDELEQFVTRKGQLEVQYDEQGNLINKLNLTGQLNVTGTWSQIEKDNYAGLSTSVWPSLTLNTNAANEQSRWQLTYKYPDEVVDGTIVPGEVIYSVYVNNDATIEEIYPTIITQAPTKASTVSTNYTFGSYRVNGSYISLSGWKLSADNKPISDYATTPTVRGNTVIYPYFNESERTYQVKWYLDSNNTQEIPTNYNAVPYGGGYDLVAPGIADIHTAGYDTATVTVNENVNPMTATYKIFNGWDKLPTNISPSATDVTYNIHAQWIEGTESLAQIFETIPESGLTAKQLLVLSAINNKNSNSIISSKGISAGLQSSYYMGYDGLKSGTTLVQKETPNYYYNRSTETDSVTTTTITPLANDQAFTLAIDYYFDPNQTYSNNSTAVAAVLAGCYENSSGSIRGFGLFQGLSTELSGVRVGFGEMFNYAEYSVPVGIVGQRNIVVLRHPAGSRYLYVYSGTTSAGIIANPVNMQPISRNISTTGATNALLNLGQLGTSSSLDNATKLMVTDAEGIIYWAKYWDEDIGAGECQQIATWPREKTTFILSKMDNTNSIGARRSGDETISPSLELLTLSGSQHALLAYSPFSQVTISWGRDTNLRSLYNTIIYNSLPLELKAILYKSLVYSQPAQYNIVNSDPTYTILTQPDSTQDYVYNLSMANVSNVDTPTSYAIEVGNGNGLLPWLDTSNVKVYNYNAQLTTRWVENTNDSSRAAYLNLRFPGAILPIFGTRVFIHAEGIMNEDTYYQAVSKISAEGILAGDIYVFGGTAYVYVTNDAILNGVPIETGTEFQCKNNNQVVGGWVAAVPYALRSLQQVQGSRTNYKYITTGGNVASNTTSTGYTANINYAFQI